MPQLLYQGYYARIVGRDPGGLSRVMKCGGSVPSFEAEVDNCRDNIAVRWVLFQASFELRNRLLLTSGGMQRHPVYIGVSCVVTVQLSGSAQLSQCIVKTLEPYQTEAERMMYSAVVRRVVDRVAQGLFAVALSPRLPV